MTDNTIEAIEAAARQLVALQFIGEAHHGPPFGGRQERARGLCNPPTISALQHEPTPIVDQDRDNRHSLVLGSPRPPLSADYRTEAHDRSGLDDRDKNKRLRRELAQSREENERLSTELGQTSSMLSQTSARLSMLQQGNAMLSETRQRLLSQMSARLSMLQQENAMLSETRQRLLRFDDNVQCLRAEYTRLILGTLQDIDRHIVTLCKCVAPKDCSIAHNDTARPEVVAFLYTGCSELGHLLADYREVQNHILKFACYLLCPKKLEGKLSAELLRDLTPPLGIRERFPPAKRAHIVNREGDTDFQSGKS